MPAISPWRQIGSCVASVLMCVVTVTPAAAEPSEAVAVATAWLGPHPSGAVETGVRRAAWQAPGAMITEQHDAHRIIRSWWPAIEDPDAAAMIDGFAWYLQTHAIEREFDARYLRTAHSVESRAYLGGHIIWSFPPLRLSRDAVAGRNRYAAAFAALERWIGVAHLQGAMFQVAQLKAERLNADTIVETISAAAGQDLSWVFAAAAPGVDLNYKVSALSSTDAAGCPAPCIQTMVDVEREGGGIFSGRSAPRIADFESGDALLLRVTFEDGTHSSVRWDGRDVSRQFTFRGPSRAIAAHLDPDRIVTLDRNRLDNAIVTPAPTNVPVGKWASRWLVWLQHTMLSYGFLA